MENSSTALNIFFWGFPEYFISKYDLITQETATLATFTDGILNGKLHFLCCKGSTLGFYRKFNFIKTSFHLVLQALKNFQGYVFKITQLLKMLKTEKMKLLSFSILFLKIEKIFVYWRVLVNMKRRLCQANAESIIVLP